MNLTAFLLSRLQFRVQVQRVSGVDLAVPDVVCRHCHEPVPNDHYSLWKATLSRSTLAFLPIVTLVLLPVIVMCTT